MYAWYCRSSRNVCATNTPDPIASVRRRGDHLSRSAARPSAKTAKQLMKRREPNASPAHQSATAAFTYQDTTKKDNAATATSRSRLNNGTRPATATATTGVQVNRPRQVEKSTASSAGSVQRMKLLPCGIARNLP